MIKTFDLEINGMTNSAMAVDHNDNISIGKLLEIEGVSVESIKDAIMCSVQYPEYAEHFMKVEMAKLYNVYHVASGWYDNGKRNIID